MPYEQQGYYICDVCEYRTLSKTKERWVKIEMELWDNAFYICKGCQGVEKAREVGEAILKRVVKTDKPKRPAGLL